jgi:hypothetical protein
MQLRFKNRQTNLYIFSLSWTCVNCWSWYTQMKHLWTKSHKINFRTLNRRPTVNVGLSSGALPWARHGWTVQYLDPLFNRCMENRWLDICRYRGTVYSTFATGTLDTVPGRTHGTTLQYICYSDESDPFIFDLRADTARCLTVHPCLAHGKAPDLSPWMSTLWTFTMTRADLMHPSTSSPSF